MGTKLGRTIPPPGRAGPLYVQEVNSDLVRMVRPTTASTTISTPARFGAALTVR